MKELLVQNRAYFILVGGFIIAALIFWQLVLPKAKVLSQLQKETENLIAKQESLDNKINSIAAKSAEWRELKNDLEKMENLVPKNNQESDVIAQIDSLSKETGVSVSAINFSKEEAKKKPPVTKTASQKSKPSKTSNKLQELKTSIALAGEMASVENFAARLVSLDRLATIESLKFSPGTNLQVILDVTFYNYPQKAIK